MKKRSNFLYIFIIAAIAAVAVLYNSAWAEGSGNELPAIASANVIRPEEPVVITIDFHDKSFDSVNGTITVYKAGSTEILDRVTKSFNINARDEVGGFTCTSSENGGAKINRIAVTFGNITENCTIRFSGVTGDDTVAYNTKDISISVASSSDFQFSIDSNELQVGATTNITSNHMQDIQLSVSEEGIVRVENNTITALRAGTVTLTATYNGESKSVDITVFDGLGGSSDGKTPTITPSESFSLNIGEKRTLTADCNVSWKSSKASVATVGSNGEVVAVSAGTAKIYATNDESGLSSYVQVKVVDPNAKPGENDNNGDEDSDETDKGGNKGTEGSSAVDGGSEGGSTTSTTGKPTTSKGNASSAADKDAPNTGEASTSTLLLVGILTLVVSAVVFRKKIK